MKWDLVLEGEGSGYSTAQDVNTDIHLRFRNGRGMDRLIAQPSLLRFCVIKITRNHDATHMSRMVKFSFYWIVGIALPDKP